MTTSSFSSPKSQNIDSSNYYAWKQGRPAHLYNTAKRQRQGSPYFVIIPDMMSFRLRFEKFQSAFAVDYFYNSISGWVRAKNFPSHLVSVTSFVLAYVTHQRMGNEEQEGIRTISHSPPAVMTPPTYYRNISTNGSVPNTGPFPEGSFSFQGVTSLRRAVFNVATLRHELALQSLRGRDRSRKKSRSKFNI